MNKTILLSLILASSAFAQTNTVERACKIVAHYSIKTESSTVTGTKKPIDPALELQKIFEKKRLSYCSDKCTNSEIIKISKPNSNEIIYEILIKNEAKQNSTCKGYARTFCNVKDMNVDKIDSQAYVNNKLLTTFECKPKTIEEIPVETASEALTSNTHHKSHSEDKCAKQKALSNSKLMKKILSKNIDCKQQALDFLRDQPEAEHVKRSYQVYLSRSSEMTNQKDCRELILKIADLAKPVNMHDADSDPSIVENSLDRIFDDFNDCTKSEQSPSKKSSTVN